MTFMPQVREVYTFLDEWAPFATQLAMDNAGLLIGSETAEVVGITVCFDITADVVRQAAAAGHSLLVSHHPVIFHPLRRVEGESIPYLLAAAGMSAICAHTNLDAAEGGVNDVLAAALDLREVFPLPGEDGAPPMARIGRLSRPMPAAGFAAYVKEKLGCGGVRYTDIPREIQRVAVLGGSGADMLQTAAAAGADALVTGEARHHELLLARTLGVSLIDGGHFCTEQKIVAELCARLSAAFPGLPVAAAQEAEPAKYI
ncbi:MAG: Nif3-like dinuclear metal center hexameric protein [Candidatus Howiella sp.]